MGDCCDPTYDEKFGDGFARRVARRYDKRGLSRPAKSIVEFLAQRGVAGVSVLEIGGGVGEIQVELLRRGAMRVTNLEISSSYEPEAVELLERTGFRGRVDRRLLDIAKSSVDVESADVVVLHRVVCCYPDYERLLAAAAEKASRQLVFSHPPRNMFSRTALWCENTWRKVKGDPFRTFAHPPSAMVSVVQEAGLHSTYRWRGLGWRVVGFER